MVCWVVNVVIGDIVKKRRLWQESFVTNCRDEKIVVCGFGCCPAFTCQFLLEKNPVGAVKCDAKTVACKFPVRLRFNFFFERVEKLLDSKGAVLDKV